MIILKILITLAGAFCFFWGGYKNHNFRRFILPLLLTLSVLWLTHSIWALTMLTSIGVFVSGYGEKSVFRHIFGNGWGRGVWGLLAGLCLSLGMFVTGHLALHWFLLYLVASFVLENALKNLNQKIGDPIIGLAFSSIVLLIN